MSPARFLQRAVHFSQRVIRETKRYPKTLHNFGFNVACHTYFDGLIPPGKSAAYIKTIENYVDRDMKELVDRYNNETITSESNPQISLEEFPIWCCWWQGESKMPELVRLCHDRLKSIIPENARLHLITFDNYQEYVTISPLIMKKYEEGKITMTTLSDILRFQLLFNYGGYWLDSTVFFTDSIPTEYFEKDFFCQRMTDNYAVIQREACKGNWCGFSMSGKSGNIVFQYMNDAFDYWWSRHDDIIDYVLIDYLLWTGYRNIPKIKEVIDTVPNNNRKIFELYQILNKPFCQEEYEQITSENVMHKLTYKMDLQKENEEGIQTVYGYIYDMVYPENEN